MDESFKKMILDYMEQGFLDNIISLFKRDEHLFPFLAEMIADERIRVRLGSAALVEELRKERPEQLRTVVPEVAALLKSANPTIRGDAAHILELIGDPNALTFLEELTDDENHHVREVVEEAIETLKAEG